MAHWKFGHFKLVSKIHVSRKLFELGAWNLAWADRGWQVDYLIKLKKKKKNLIFPELWPFENLGILNLSARYLENYLS